MKRLLGLLAVAVLALTGCGGNVATQLEDGKLTVGMECDYAPYNWTTTKEQAGEFCPVERLRSKDRLRSERLASFEMGRSTNDQRPGT